MRRRLLIGLSAATLLGGVALLLALRTTPPAEPPPVATAPMATAASAVPEEAPPAGLDAVVGEAVTASVLGDDEALRACVERLRRDRPEAERLIQERARRAMTAREMRLLEEIAEEVGR